jgi:hypothetical protein
MTMADKQNWHPRENEFATQQRRRLPDSLQLVVPNARGSSGAGLAPNSAPSQALMNTLPEPWRTLLYGIQRKASFIPLFGTVGTTAVLVRPAEERTYIIIQNTSAANQLIVGIGYQPVNNGTSVTGLILAANGGNYEPSAIPQGDIWLLGSAANTGFVVHVANG